MPTARHPVGRVQKPVRRGGWLPFAASGEGTVLLACHGALDRVDLAPGESVAIDSGHVVAFGPTVTSQLGKAAGRVGARRPRRHPRGKLRARRGTTTNQQLTSPVPVAKSRGRSDHSMVTTSASRCPFSAVGLIADV